MPPLPPQRISFILLKSFAPGSLLSIPRESYVRFHEDIPWQWRPTSRSQSTGRPTTTSKSTARVVGKNI